LKTFCLNNFLQIIAKLIMINIMAMSFYRTYQQKNSIQVTYPTTTIFLHKKSEEKSSENLSLQVRSGIKFSATTLETSPPLDLVNISNFSHQMEFLSVQITIVLLQFCRSNKQFQIFAIYKKKWQKIFSLFKEDIYIFFHYHFLILSLYQPR